MFRVVALVLAVSGLGLGSSAQADEAEDKAVAFVEKQHGGRVIRDDKVPGKPVVMVNLGSTKVTDAGLKELTPLKSLTKLTLSGTLVTDAGLKELKSLKSLATLD